MWAIVIGASGGIGRALVDALANDAQISGIIATYHRNSHFVKTDVNIPVHQRQLDVTDEQSIRQFVSALAVEFARPADVKTSSSPAVKTPIAIRYVVNCVGILHSDTLSMSPEKSLQAFSAETLHKSIACNTAPTLLLAKHLAAWLKGPEHCVFASISARVGSISDNRLGGWYSYRLSKAALNMAIKTLAIEWQRTHRNVSVIALHPGTTDTALSEPFQHNVPEGKLFSAAQTAGFLLETLSSVRLQQSGEFLAFDGTSIDW